MKQATTSASRSWSGESPPPGRWLHKVAQITKTDDLRSCFDPTQPAMSVDIAAPHDVATWAARARRAATLGPRRGSAAHSMTIFNSGSY